MYQGKRFVLAALLALATLPCRTAFAADDLQSVLHKLDAAARNFRSTAADFTFDTEQLVPRSRHRYSKRHRLLSTLGQCLQNGSAHRRD